MSQPNNNRKIRKILFDIFQEMTQEDVESTNFFIRCETGKKCKDIYELMEILENLVYFRISGNKVDAKRFLELLFNINRADLKNKLQVQLESFCSKSIFFFSY